MIPLIEKEVVERRRWIEREEFTEMLTLAQSAPGPISINSAVFVGYKTLGLGGMITAVLGTVIPSFVVILLVAMFFTDIRENPTVERIFRGIRPAVVSLIVVPVRLIGHDCSAGCLVVWRFARLGYRSGRRDRCHLPFLDRERAPREIKWTK